MSVPSGTLEQRIRSAMQLSSAREIVSGVKNVVEQEVSSLSPDAKVRRTEYFNHSYMPDLVLEWNGGKRPEDVRPIFLRNSMEPSAVEADVQSLAVLEPVVLSLTESGLPPDSLDAVRQRARAANRVLVTDVASLAEIATPTRAPGRGRDPSRADAPLLRLVQANLLKGGRGLLTNPEVERLTRSAEPPEQDASFTEESLRSFEASADELFASDAALRLRRAAEVLRFGLSQDFRQTLPLSEGLLSDGELRVLLPFLLNDERAKGNARLWDYLGSMMSLERLEELWAALPGVDVSPLVVPNVVKWKGKRAQLVINSSYAPPSADALPVAHREDDAGEYQPGADGVSAVSDEPPVPSWFLRNRMLSAEAGPWRLFVTTDARRLKGRRDSAAARWDELGPLLTGFALDAVDLRGVSRRILVGAEQSGDVSADVARIRANIEDEFHVTEVRVRRIGDDDDASVRVDFTEMTATAEGQASVSALVLAANLLGHRQRADLAALLGQGA